MRFQFQTKVAIIIAGPKERPKAGSHLIEPCPHALPPGSRLQHAADDSRDSLPVLGFDFELLATGLRDGIELCLTVVLGCAPLSRDPLFLDQTDEAKINCALIHLKRFFA